MSLTQSVSRKLTLLRGAQLTAFLGTVGTIVVLHAPNGPQLGVLRIPSHLHYSSTTLGVPWPESITIYHVCLAAFFLFSTLTIIGLYSFNSWVWRSVTAATSLANSLILALVVLFFATELALHSKLSSSAIETAAFFATFFVVFFVANIVTFAFVRSEDTEELAAHSAVQF